MSEVFHGLVQYPLRVSSPFGYCDWDWFSVDRPELRATPFLDWFGCLSSPPRRSNGNDFRIGADRGGNSRASDYGIVPLFAATLKRKLNRLGSIGRIDLSGGTAEDARWIGTETMSYLIPS